MKRKEINYVNGREEIIMIKRANIRIKGDVQMAGFRTFIKNTADSFNLKGFAENVEEGSVRVVCEGEEGGINELINLIKENTPSFARIEEVDVTYEEYKGEFSGFERRGADVPEEESEMLALMRSFDKKGEVMIGILSSMNGTMSSMNGTMKSVKEDTSKMLEKQDDTIGAMVEVSEKIDNGKEEIVTEIRSLREDLKSYMESKFGKIEHEIEAIKAKIGMT